MLDTTPLPGLTRPDLWAVIAGHPMPADASGRSFVAQLQRKAGIKAATAERAVLEYRRFLYLVALDEGRRVPSPAVDVVWHLHMQHSRDYWEGLCAALGRPLHHTPGGESGPGSADVRATGRAYVREFGAAMPRALWRRRNRRAERGRGWLGLGGLAAAAGLFVAGAPGGLVLGLGAVSAVLLVSGLTTLAGDAGIEIAWDPTDYWGDGAGGDCGGDGGGCGGD